MKQPDSVEMKKINYEKLFVTNDHMCYYGNPADVFEAARDGKQNFYVMYPVRTPIFDMCRMVELVGNSNDIYNDGGSVELDNSNDGCLSRFFLNILDIMIGLTDGTVDDVWMNEFFVLATSMFRAEYVAENPTYLNGNEVPFRKFVMDHLIEITDESYGQFHNGIYSTDEVAMMAVCVFGTKDQFIQFGNWLRTDYHPTAVFDEDHGDCYKVLLSKFSEDGKDHELKRMVRAQIEKSKKNQKNED